jgi:hypothetical protein
MKGGLYVCVERVVWWEESRQGIGPLCKAFDWPTSGDRDGGAYKSCWEFT